VHRNIAGAATLAISLACAVPAVASGSASSRTATSDYTLATSANRHGPVAFVGEQRFGYAITKVRRGDRTVSVTVRDTSGQRIQAYVEQWTGRRYVQLATICGSTTRPVRLARDSGSVNVRPTYGVCGTTPSAPTTGSVTFHFSR
jgi:hypothetical protein